MILKELPETLLGFAPLVQWSDTNPDVTEEEVAHISLSTSMDCDRLITELRESKLSDKIMSIQFQTSHFTRFMPIGSLQYWHDVYEAEKLHDLCGKRRRWLIDKCYYEDLVCIKLERSLTKSDHEIHATRRTGMHATEFYLDW